MLRSIIGLFLLLLILNAQFSQRGEQMQQQDHVSKDTHSDEIHAPVNQNTSNESSHSTREELPSEAPIEEIQEELIIVVTQEKTSKKWTAILYNAEAILIPVIVMGYISGGLLLLWYIAGGALAFIGLLASSIVTLSTLIGIFWKMFLRKVLKFLTKRHSIRRRLFWTASLVACVLAILAIMWAFIWQFDPYHYTGWSVLDSSLSSYDNYWHSEINTKTNASCQFDRGAYKVTAVPSYVHYCYASSAVFDDFIYQVQMKFLRGECGGIVFRADPENGTLYFFEICRNLTYDFIRWDSVPAKDWQYLLVGQPDNGQPDNLKSILKNDNIQVNQSVTLAVIAKGNIFQLWVNHQELDVGFDVSARELKVGAIGVAASGPALIAFSNAKVWTFYGG